MALAFKTKNNETVFLKEEMKIYLAGSIAGKTKEREHLLRKSYRLLSFYEINKRLFKAHLSFKLRMQKK